MEKDKKSKKITEGDVKDSVFSDDNGKPTPPKKIGHELLDKRPHFKSFKSPGVK